MTTADVIELPVEPAEPAEPGTFGAEQLSLGLTTADGRPLRPSRVHTRFRLDADTRQRGLRHVAEIRARLAETAPPDQPTTDSDETHSIGDLGDLVDFPTRIRPGQRAS